MPNKFRLEKTFVAGRKAADKSWRATVEVWEAKVVWEIGVGLVRVDWEIEAVGQATVAAKG